MGKEIGIIGLGKMGAGLARNLLAHNWRVVAFNRTAAVTRAMEVEGIIGAYHLKELVQKLKPPRIVWLMLPNGAPTDEVIFGAQGLRHLLSKGDTIVEGANSYFKDTQARYRKLAKTGFGFVDVGVSGGPAGARNGACLMIGGSKKLFKKLEPLFRDIAAPQAYAHFVGPGAGHFVKMVHNGIEYGMMQALAEGFTVLKKSPYHIDLKRAGYIYNHQSVIESRLVSWLNDALEQFGVDLRSVSGAVGYTGEGEWTVKTAKKLGVPTPILAGSFKYRVQSQKKPTYTGKLLSAMRNQFGGHAIKKAPIRH